MLVVAFGVLCLVGRVVLAGFGVVVPLIIPGIEYPVVVLFAYGTWDGWVAVPSSRVWSDPRLTDFTPEELDAISGRMRMLRAISIAFAALFIGAVACLVIDLVQRGAVPPGALLFGSLACGAVVVRSGSERILPTVRPTGGHAQADDRRDSQGTVAVISTMCTGLYSLHPVSENAPGGRLTRPC